VAVQIADGRGISIDSGFLDELFGFFGLGEVLFDIFIVDFLGMQV
jgi:hypothetical protein